MRRKGNDEQYRRVSDETPGCRQAFTSDI